MLKDDIEAVKQIAEKHLYLDTISFLYLYEFEELAKFKTKSYKISTVRARFRKALNACFEQGLCEKFYLGTTYQQTSDTLGGKVCISYDFSKSVLKKNKIMNKENNNPNTARPLQTTLPELRQRAMETPFLSPDFTDNDINLSRHCIAGAYHNYLFAVIVVCVLIDKKFYWRIQSGFVAKNTGKYIKLSLLTKNERETLERAKDKALGTTRHYPKYKKEKLINCVVWTVPFNDADYENLNPLYLDLTDYPYRKINGEDIETE